MIVHRAVVAAIFVALVAANSADTDVADSLEVLSDDGVKPLEVDEFLQSEGGKVSQVVVNVAKKARAPEPTVKALTPKHEEIQKSKWKKTHKGKVLTKSALTEIKRVAKVAASKEINQARRNKVALKKARRQEKELIRQVKKNRKFASQVEANRQYSAQQSRRKEARVEKAAARKLRRRTKKEEKAAALAIRAQYEAEHAGELAKKAKAATVKARDHLLRTQRQDEMNADSVTKAGVILAKHNAEIETQQEAVHRAKHVLEHIEDHEEAAHMEVNEAKIKADFEEADARKVSHLLKKLMAKKAAVDKFTKTLHLKSKLDKFTKEAAKYESKLTHTKKLIKEANQGVVLGLSMGKSAKAIKSAENHSYLRKVESKMAQKVDKADVKAKGQNKLMGASMQELEKAEALDTVARKEADRVKQNRATVKAQVKKIAFFKSEVAAHKQSAEKAKRRAALALHRAKTIRSNAETTVKKGEARLRWLRSVVVPFGVRAQKKAKNAKRISKQKVKEAKDKLSDAVVSERRLALLAQKQVNGKNAAKEKLQKKKVKMKSATKQKRRASDAQKNTTFKLNKKMAQNKKLEAKLKGLQKKKQSKPRSKPKVAKRKGGKELAEAAQDTFAAKFGFKP